MLGEDKENDAWIEQVAYEEALSPIHELSDPTSRKLNALNKFKEDNNTVTEKNKKVPE